MKKLEEAGYRLHPKKCEFFKKEAEWIGHKIDQEGVRPLQYKLEAITKLPIPKNKKELKIIFGGNTILIKLHRESVSTNRYTQKTIEETKRMDVDRRTYGSIQ